MLPGLRSLPPGAGGGAQAWCNPGSQRTSSTRRWAASLHACKHTGIH